MNQRFLGFLALTCLVFTVIWLALLIAGLVTAGPLDTFEQVLAYISALDVIFYRRLD